MLVTHPPVPRTNGAQFAPPHSAANRPCPKTNMPTAGALIAGRRTQRAAVLVENGPNHLLRSQRHKNQSEVVTGSQLGR
jgi:hypothetical protein